MFICNIDTLSAIGCTEINPWKNLITFKFEGRQYAGKVKRGIIVKRYLARIASAEETPDARAMSVHMFYHFISELLQGESDTAMKMKQDFRRELLGRILVSIIIALVVINLLILF